MKCLLLLRLALDDSAPACPRAAVRASACTRSSGLLRLLVAALGLLLQCVDALFQAVEIGEHQFGLDGLDVGDRIDLALDMRDVAVLEAAHDMRDGVDLADVGEKLVAQPLALRRAAHEARDIDEGEPRRNDLADLAISASVSSRGSGTATSPTFGSIVQNG